jgi:hypothetical protein
MGGPGGGGQVNESPAQGIPRPGRVRGLHASVPQQLDEGSDIAEGPRQLVAGEQHLVQVSTASGGVLG